jgi:hypothetical protein
MPGSDKRQLVASVISAIRQAGLHYGLWFAETAHQLGLEAALRAEAEAGDKGTAVVVKRVCEALGTGLEDGQPEALLGLDEPTLKALLDSLAVSWLALDGVWFQAVEKLADMEDAKRVNDTCWSRFAAVEARQIMALQGLEENGGLEALKQALGLRLYSRVNVSEMVEQTKTSFVFRMRQCRVQTARKRKGLTDYPCRSGGLVEYRTFAKAMDPRIRVTCLACPPDPHPDDWYCAWRFEIEG